MPKPETRHGSPGKRPSSNQNWQTLRPIPRRPEPGATYAMEKQGTVVKEQDFLALTRTVDFLHTGFAEPKGERYTLHPSRKKRRGEREPLIRCLRTGRGLALASGMLVDKVRTVACSSRAFLAQLIRQKKHRIIEPESLGELAIKAEPRGLSFHRTSDAFG